MSPLGVTISRQVADDAFVAVSRQINFARNILPADELLAVLLRVGIGLACDGIASVIATELNNAGPRAPEDIVDAMIAEAVAMLHEARDQVITLARLGARLHAAADAPTDQVPA